MSAMRWGDSDSSDEEDVVKASSLTQQQERLEQMHLRGDMEGDEAPRQPPPKPFPSSSLPPQRHGNYSDHHDTSDRLQSEGYQHQQQYHQGRGGRGGGGGRGRDSGGRGGGFRKAVPGGYRESQPRDWKEMAKSASKFGPESAADLDTSSWMAQRKAKQHEHEEERRREIERQKMQEEEEKRQRRKSQFQALKAAVKTIEETQLHPPVLSSLQAAAGGSHKPSSVPSSPIHTSLKPPISPSSPINKPPIPASSPLRILKRPSVEPDHAGTTSIASSHNEENESTTSSHSSSRRSFRGGRGRGSRGGRGRFASGGRGRGRGRNDGESERSFDSVVRWQRANGHWNNETESLQSDSGSHTSGRGGNYHRGRGEGKGRGRHESQGRHGGRGRNDSQGNYEARGRGRRNKGTKIEPGKPQVVRTSSGTVEYHISLDQEEKPKTQGELLPNGTVRLSKKGKGSHKGHRLTRSPIQTKLEIGKDDAIEK